MTDDKVWVNSEILSRVESLHWRLCLHVQKLSFSASYSINSTQGVSITHFAGRVPTVKIFGKLIKTQPVLLETQDRSDKVESRLKPNPTQGPKAKMTSNNQLSNW